MSSEHFEFNMIKALEALPKIDIVGLVEIFILAVIAYRISKMLKDTKAWVLVKAVLIILLAYVAAMIFKLNVIVTIFKGAILFIGIALITLMQPELRRLLEKIGTSGIDIKLDKIICFFRNMRENEEIIKNISDETVQEIVKGCSLMSKVKTGVLIVIENETPLNEYSETGITVDAKITSQLLINIFEKNTPLHDGAVIIKRDRVESATCYLPLTSSNGIDKSLGTRHRAAIGISEVTDALVIVVSEETGGISVAHKGKLKTKLSREELDAELRKFQVKHKQKIDKKKENLRKPDFKLAVATVVGSILLWVIMMDTINPIVSNTIHNVPIQMLNTSTLVSLDKTYEIESSTLVDVTVKGRKSEIDEITSESLIVTADFKALSITNSVPVNCNIPGYSDIECKLSSQTLDISIENLVSSAFEIEVEEIGKVSDEYYLSGIDLNTDEVVITGAESVVNTIGKVTARVNLDDVNHNLHLETELTVYDKNGTLIDNSKLKLSQDKIGLDIRLYNTKVVNININCLITNPVIKRLMTRAYCETDTIRIAGTDEDLEKVSEINITYPFEINPLDVSNNKYSKLISIVNLVPDGVLVSEDSMRVKITAEFIDFYSELIELKASDIVVNNLTEGMQVEISDADKQLVVVDTNGAGMKDFSQLSPVIDLTDVGIGKHQLNIELEGLPVNTTLVYGDTQVSVLVSYKE